MYHMIPTFWEIEEYEDPEFDFRVRISSKGIPIYIEYNQSIGDFFEINRHLLPRKSKNVPKTGIFVLDKNNDLYMAPRNVDISHHSDFLKGNAVICAGEYKLNSDGAVLLFNNKSGHYQPKHECLEHVKKIVGENYSGKVKYLLYI